MRLLLRYSFMLLFTILVMAIGIATAVMLQRVDPAQQKPNIETFSFADTLANQEHNLDSLVTIIGENKGLPEGFEVAAAIAYSAYPQLKEVKIDMILTKDGPPMMADIDVWSLFGSKKNRRYNILLNDAQNTFYDPILLRALPFDAQVGILAHELGHVVYYHKLSLFQMGKWGLCYLRSDQFHLTHERTTDLMPVYHGLGSQIYQYAYFVRHDPSCSTLYQAEKGFIDKYYMTDTELLKAINNR